jgi:coenzyme F420 hydrogenase subunit beta
MTEVKELYDKIIKNGYCIGCGNCTTIKNSPFTIKLNKYGLYDAFANEDELNENNESVLSICPFSDNALNEIELSKIFLPDTKFSNNLIGDYIKCYAGYVKYDTFRANGSSGGFGKWLGYILLEENKIDYFVQVYPNKSTDHNDVLFEYSISNNKYKTIDGSKSAYYPVTLESIIREIKKLKGRFAITGLPCFIKAIRLLSLNDEEFRGKIKFTIGIVCGGLKSANHAKMVGWSMGIEPENLALIDFRKKTLDKPASHKIYQVWSNIDKLERESAADKIFGADYGTGFFKPKSCDYCDDIVAETADISLGDAWLPEIMNDPNGNSVIIIRNNEINELLLAYSQKALIIINEISEDLIIKSQDGGIRHRREGLAYRIQKKHENLEFVPQKRINLNDYKITPKRQKIYKLREAISIKSHDSFYTALCNNELSLFYKEMKPLVKQYNNIYKRPLIMRIINKIFKILKFRKLF